MSSRLLSTGLLFIHARVLTVHHSSKLTPSLVRHSSGPLNSNLPQPSPTKCDLERQGEKQEELPEPVKQVMIKRIPVEYHGIAPANFSDETIWHPIYRFPYIIPLRLFVRLQVWLSGGVMCLCTYRLYKYALGELDTILYTLGTTTVSMVGLALFGVSFKKLIVQIYASDDGSLLRFCRFTAFGKRLDMVLPRNCIMPLSDINRTVRNRILNIRTKRPENINLAYDNHEFYDDDFKLVISFGGVKDLERFNKALGRFLMRKFD